MKPLTQKRFVFIAKSMLWSLLLYATFMLACNWDEVSNKVRGINPITVVNNISAGAPGANSTVVHPASISHQAGILYVIIAVANSFGNFVR